MARPHKQMPGRTYHIIHDVDGSATVECTYLCPYCDQETSATFYVDENGSNLVEREGFFESLECCLCGKVTDVRFYNSNKI